MKPPHLLPLFFLSLALATPFAQEDSESSDEWEDPGPTTTCYTDGRAAPYNPDVITLLAIVDADANTMPGYPWEVS